MPSSVVYYSVVNKKHTVQLIIKYYHRHVKLYLMNFDHPWKISLTIKKNLTLDYLFYVSNEEKTG